MKVPQTTTSLVQFPLDVNITTVHRLLSKMANSWDRRAQVLKHFALEEYSFFDDADDFLEELLPFHKHPDYQRIHCEQKKKILTCGWLIYNQKTIAIEKDIIHQACFDIISDNVPGVTDAVSKEIAGKTLVDESYHVLLVIKAMTITRQKRGINLKIPSFSLVRNMNQLQSSYPENWKKTLVLLATAIVSEIFISDYLKLLSDNTEIQQLNRLTVATHRKDEMAHGNIFKQLTRCIYASLGKKQKEFFAEILPKPVRWFADKEMAIWKSVLDQIGIKNTRELVNDCRSVNNRCLEDIDYSELVSLAEEIGLTNIPVGAESFHNEGLIVK